MEFRGAPHGIARARAYAGRRLLCGRYGAHSGPSGRARSRSAPPLCRGPQIAAGRSRDNRRDSQRKPCAVSRTAQCCRGGDRDIRPAGLRDVRASGAPTGLAEPLEAWRAEPAPLGSKTLYSADEVTFLPRRNIMPAASMSRIVLLAFAACGIPLVFAIQHFRREPPVDTEAATAAPAVSKPASGAPDQNPSALAVSPNSDDGVAAL